MDVMSILNALNQGGPTVMFIIMGGLMWLQHLTIMSLKRDLEAITTLFSNFQVVYANERVRKDDLDEIKTLIKENNEATKALIARMFDKLDDHVSRCGKDCLASLMACADFQNAKKKVID